METRISKKKIRMWMAIRGFEKVEDLASKAEISPNTIYTSWDTNKFQGQTLDKMASTLNVNPIDLLDTEGYPDPHLGAPAFAG